MKTALTIILGLLGFTLTMSFMLHNLNAIVLKGHERSKVGLVFSLFYIIFAFIYIASSAIVLDQLGFVYALSNIIIFPVMISTLINVISNRIPFNKNIYSGKRKVSKFNKYLLLFGITMLIMCIIFLLAILIFPSRFQANFRWYDLFRFGFIFSIIGYIVDYYNKKTLLEKQINEEEFRQKPFAVLYLRSFYLDEIPFDHVEKNITIFGNLSKFESHARGGLLGKSYDLSFTEYFGHCTTSILGEFICIGNPTDSEIKEGANVLYPKPELWKNYFHDYLLNTGLIFMNIGDSKFIDFEIESVKKAKKLNSLFLFTKPKSTNSNKYTLLKKFFDWIRNYRELDWSELKVKLNINDINVTIPHMSGMVFTFDENFNTILVAKNCSNPLQYITAIRKYCQEHKIVY